MVQVKGKYIDQVQVRDCWKNTKTSALVKFVPLLSTFVQVFKSIPFAGPVSGSNRWKDPQSVYKVGSGLE